MNLVLATSSSLDLTLPRSLVPGELHIWHGPLLVPSTLRADLEQLLTPDEKSRAAKFRAPHSRDSFIASRIFLRRLLSAYIGIDPSNLRLTSGPHGKPRLADSSSPINFNLSHSHGMGLLAFAQSADVGVDLERIRPDITAMEIAQLFFSPAEITELTKLPPTSRTAAFFRCWTRKEAYVKARGAGMSLPLDTFTIDFAHDRAQLICDEDGSLWTSYNLDLSDDFAAAVVAAGEGWKLRHFQWTSETAPS